MDAQRRSALRRVGLVIGVGALAAPVVVGTLRPAPLASERFASIGAAVATLAQRRAVTPRRAVAPDLARGLHHAAQSIEHSMTGYPALRPAWFRATLGAYAFALSNSRGAASHELAEPNGGASDIDSSPASHPDDGQALVPALDHALAAWRAFDAHAGPLQPHFAYGTLDKPAYTRVHLMHFASHWTDAGVAA